MKRLLTLLYISFNILTNLHAEEDFSFKSLVDLDGLPSASVGHVNIITGDFSDISIDLVIPGPHRSVSSAHTSAPTAKQARSATDGTLIISDCSRSIPSHPPTTHNRTTNRTAEGN